MPMSPQTLLREAADKIESALTQLNIRAAPCKHCGNLIFEEFLHAQIHRRFMEMPTKLRKDATRLDTKQAHTAPDGAIE